MSSHTPGPWVDETAEFGRHEGRVCAYEASGNRSMLVVVQSFNPEEDARLIATATAMLEALRAVVRVADRKTVEFDLARAAIAKATGERP